MKYTYTEIIDIDGRIVAIQRNDFASIPLDEGNKDYQEYLKSLNN